MRTETRIGVVTGLLVVVIASVYFWRTKTQERDLIVALTPGKPAASPAPAIAIPRPGPADAALAQRPSPAPVNLPAAPALASPISLAAAPPDSSVFGPPASYVPLRTGPSDILRDAASPKLETGPAPTLTAATDFRPIGPPPVTAPLSIPGAAHDVPPTSETSAAAPSDANHPWPKYHLVARGETLAAIARETYDDPRRIDLILAANPEVRDPRRLKVGTKLTLPSPPSAPRARVAESPSRPSVPLAAAPTTPPVSDPLVSLMARPAGPAAPPPADPVPAKPAAYVVQPGDSFYSIAESTLGSASRWKELFELNKKAVAGDPRKLRAGMSLILPEKK